MAPLARGSGGAARIGPGLLTRVRQHATVVVRVQAPDADPVLLEAALTEGLTRVAAVSVPSRAPEAERPAYVAPPIRTPDGTVLLIDFGALPPKVRAASIGLIADALTEAGVPGAVVGLPREVHADWQAMKDEGPAVRGYARGVVRRPYGDAESPGVESLVEGLLPLVRGLAGDALPLYGLVITAATPLEWAGAADFTLNVLAAGSQMLTLVASDGRGRLVSLAIDAGTQAAFPAVAVTTLGGDPVATQKAMREALTGLAPSLVWAAVTASVDAARWDSSQWDQYERADDVPRSAGGETFTVTDLLVPDVAWWQVLGPDHIARLGSPPAGSQPLGAGRYELTLGTPEGWLPGAPGRADVVAAGRDLLAPLLLSGREAQALAGERMRRAREHHPEYFRRPPRR